MLSLGIETVVNFVLFTFRSARWPNGKVPESGTRDPGTNTYRVVLICLIVIAVINTKEIKSKTFL